MKRQISQVPARALPDQSNVTAPNNNRHRHKVDMYSRGNRKQLQLVPTTCHAAAQMYTSKRAPSLLLHSVWC
jgi:hypothetical protein